MPMCIGNSLKCMFWNRTAIQIERSEMSLPVSWHNHTAVPLAIIPERLTASQSRTALSPTPRSLDDRSSHHGCRTRWVPSRRFSRQERTCSDRSTGRNHRSLTRRTSTRPRSSSATSLSRTRPASGRTPPSAAITGRSSWEREPTSRITPSSTRRPNSSPIRPSGTAPSFTTRPSPNER